MTKLQIIRRLWTHIFDLQALISGQGRKSMENIQQEINVTAGACEIYDQCDDDELYALDVLRAAKKIQKYRSGGNQNTEAGKGDGGDVY